MEARGAGMSAFFEFDIRISDLSDELLLEGTAMHNASDNRKGLHHSFVTDSVPWPTIRLLASEDGPNL